MAKGYGFEVSDLLLVAVVGGSAYLLYKTVQPLSEGAGKVAGAAGDAAQTTADAYKYILEQEGAAYRAIIDSFKTGNVDKRSTVSNTFNTNILPNTLEDLYNVGKTTPTGTKFDIITIPTTSRKIASVGAMSVLQSVANPQAPTAANTVMASNAAKNANSILNLGKVTTTTPPPNITNPNYDSKGILKSLAKYPKYDSKGSLKSLPKYPNYDSKGILKSLAK